MSIRIWDVPYMRMGQYAHMGQNIIIGNKPENVKTYVHTKNGYLQSMSFLLPLFIICTCIMCLYSIVNVHVHSAKVLVTY